MDYVLKKVDRKNYVYVIKDCFSDRYFKSFNVDTGDIVFTDYFDDCYKFFLRQTVEAVYNVLFKSFGLKFEIKEV